MKACTLRLDRAEGQTAPELLHRTITTRTGGVTIQLYTRWTQRCTHHVTRDELTEAFQREMFAALLRNHTPSNRLLNIQITTTCPNVAAVFVLRTCVLPRQGLLGAETGHVTNGGDLVFNV